MPNKSTVAIIGAGPAGMAAALQLKHYGIDFIVCDKNLDSGSLLYNAWQVENLLGFAPMSGRELLTHFRKELQDKAINILTQEVTHVNYSSSEHQFILHTLEEQYLADYVIVASGTQTKPLPWLSDTPKNLQHLFHTEVKPLLSERNKTIVIIGAGDAAFDFAISLAERNNEIHIKNKSFEIKALQKLQDKVREKDNIFYSANCSLQAISAGDEKELKCEFANAGKNLYVETDYLIAAIGRIPQCNYLTDMTMQLQNNLLLQGKLYFAGDVKNNNLRQVAIAIGDGISAAMQISLKINV